MRNQVAGIRANGVQHSSGCASVLTTLLMRRANLVLSVDDGVLYLSAMVPDPSKRSSVTVTVSQDRTGAPNLTLLPFSIAVENPEDLTATSDLDQAVKHGG